MNRFSSIALILYLVATHAVAAPIHLVIDHGHPLFVSSLEGVLHAHGPDGEDHDEHPDHEAAVAAVPEGEVWLRDASNFGAPHRHDAHAHSATDHGFHVVRTTFSMNLPAAVLPAFYDAAPAPAVGSVPPTESPPQQPTAQRSTPHRGPPVG